MLSLTNREILMEVSYRRIIKSQTLRLENPFITPLKPSHKREIALIVWAKNLKIVSITKISPFINQ